MDSINLYQYGIYKEGTGNGINDFLYRSTQILKKDISIHFINFDLSSETSYESHFIEENIQIHVFQKIRNFGFSFPKAFIDWLDKIPSNSVFHIHSVFRIQNFTLAYHLTQKRIPYIFTPHDSYSPESLKKKWFLKKILLCSTEKYILRHAHAIQAITSIGNKHIKSYSNQQTKLVHNFIFDQEESTLKMYANPEKQVCFIGRFDIYQKGIDLLLEAFSQFLGKTNQEISLKLIGPSKQNELIQVNKIIKKKNLRIDNDVFILGFLENSLKYQNLSASYVYMQLSRYEGFSYSVVEALSCGKPVIISHYIPIHNYIEKYEAGFVVHNIEEASQALEKIFQLSPDAYYQMCANARRCYLENFHPDIILPLLLEMYQSVFYSLQEK
jgi:glycosyltransferase involved in cell wall biosynthesis